MAADRIEGQTLLDDARQLVEEPGVDAASGVDLIDRHASAQHAEDFINKSAIRTWEHTGGQLWPGRDVSFATLKGLNEFVGRKRDGFGQFEQWVSTPLDRFIEQISLETSPNAKGAQTTTELDVASTTTQRAKTG